MKITKERVEQIIREEIAEALKELDEGYSKYGTGEDYSQRKARQAKLKKMNAPKDSKFKSEPLGPMEELEAKMAIGLLKNSPETLVRVTQKVYDYIKEMDPSILDRVELRK